MENKKDEQLTEKNFGRFWSRYASGVQVPMLALSKIKWEVLELARKGMEAKQAIEQVSAKYRVN